MDHRSGDPCVIQVESRQSDGAKPVREQLPCRDLIRQFTINRSQ